MLSPTHNGVLLPAELHEATAAEKDAYATRVKSGNRAFCDAYFALDDAARSLGYPSIEALAD